MITPTLYIVVSRYDLILHENKLISPLSFKIRRHVLDRCKIYCMNSYGQTSPPLFCGEFTKKSNGALLRLVHKRQSTHGNPVLPLHEERYLLNKRELTRDGSVLGELAHNFANLGGDKRITRKRQAIRNLRITNRTVHLTVLQDSER
jgi:hypothetical protein